MDDSGEYIELDDVQGLVDDAAPRTVAVVLLEGQEVIGPFHRTGAEGGPLVEVYEAELDQATGRGRLRRLGLVGLLPHTADTADLLERFGAGVWICQVRSARGQLLGTRWVATGTRTQREKAAIVATAKKSEVESGTSEAPVWLQSLLQRMSEDKAQLEAQVAELRTKEERRQADHAARMERELAELRTRLERTTTPTSPDVDPVRVLKRRLEEADEIRHLLAPEEPEEPEKDFMDEAEETMGGLLGKYMKAKGMLDDLQSLSGDGTP